MKVGGTICVLLSYCLRPHLKIRSVYKFTQVYSLGVPYGLLPLKN